MSAQVCIVSMVRISAFSAAAIRNEKISICGLCTLIWCLLSRLCFLGIKRYAYNDASENSMQLLPAFAQDFLVKPINLRQPIFFVPSFQDISGCIPSSRTGSGFEEVPSFFFLVKRRNRFGSHQKPECPSRDDGSARQHLYCKACNTPV